MTVIDPRRLKVIEANLPPPTACEVCSKPFDDENPVRKARYGPFSVSLCPSCCNLDTFKDFLE